MLHGIRVVFSPEYEVDIGPHVFPTRKYRLVRDRLLSEGVIDESDLVPPEPACVDDIRLVHDPDYVTKILEDSFTYAERMTLEIPFTEEVRDASMLCCGGTAATGRLALEDGVAVHLGGGFHHAFPDHGEGFCLLNDVAVAARMLQAEGLVGRVAIVDLDVHHGNGTAAVFADDPEVFTFSMHQQDNYPLVKPPSDLDVGLDDHTADDEYITRLGEALNDVLAAGPFDLMVYLAGADPYRYDQLGGLALTKRGLRARDELVLEMAGAVGLPVAITLAGGYAIEPEDTVEIHCGTVEAGVG